MKDNPWIEFLVFTRKERIAAIVLSSLIVITAVAPYFIPEKKFITPARGEFEAFNHELEKLKSNGPDSNNIEATQPWQRNYPLSDKENRTEHFTHFYFDPNKITEDDWKKLGLRDRTIKTIVNFRNKGGRFKDPIDLKKIYGLKEEEFERLLPFVRIEQLEPPKRKTDSSFVAHDAYETKRFNSNKPHSIDINKADSTEWIDLPGIGNKLAGRIINFRNKLGGFYSVQQISEVYGLSDSTYSKIKDFLICNATSVTQININIARVEELKLHPYIKWDVANAIIRFRQTHGNFKTLEDLKQILIIDELLYQKISPYLKIE